MDKMCYLKDLEVQKAYTWIPLYSAKQALFNESVHWSVKEVMFRNFLLKKHDIFSTPEVVLLRGCFVSSFW